MSAPLFAMDSSCMIAAVCAWHESHDVVTTAIEKRFRQGEHLVTAAHAVAEAYAVLTRLPAPHRLSPADAWRLVETNFVKGVKVHALAAQQHVTVLAQLAERGVGGGRTYDALIAETAQAAGADVLLTLNSRHFSPAPAGLQVVDPGTGDE